MFESASFFISWFLVLTFAGAVLYIIDRNVGKRAYRWFYDMTHEHPLPPGVERGFLYQRRAHSRFAVAVLVAAGQSALAVYYGVASVPNEMLSLFIEIPCLMIGFALGPVFYRFWSRREEVFDAVDQLEQGSFSVRDEVREMSQKAVAKIREVVAPAEAEPAAAEAKKVEEPVDAKAFMAKYLQR